MLKIWTKIIGFTITASLLMSGMAAAAGPEAAPMVIVADTRKLTGLAAWWANLYNESHVYFTLVTVVIIPIVGLCFGLLADFVMKWIGIDLKIRELAEH